MSIVKFKVYLVEYAANKNISEVYITTQNFISNRLERYVFEKPGTIVQICLL